MKEIVEGFTQVIRNLNLAYYWGKRRLNPCICMQHANDYVQVLLSGVLSRSPRPP